MDFRTLFSPLFYCLLMKKKYEPGRREKEAHYLWGCEFSSDSADDGFNQPCIL